MTNTTPNPQTVQTHHFGPVEVFEHEVIHLLSPLPPFVALTRYVLLRDPAQEPFLWLQSLEQPALFFIVAPHAAVAGPAPALTALGRRELALLPSEEPEAYVIISLGGGTRAVTMNLLAPLYLSRSAGRGRETCRGRQMLVEGDLALARVPLFPDSSVLQGGSSGAGPHASG
jgi:flagellar assembly factor FliW